VKLVDDYKIMINVKKNNQIHMKIITRIFWAFILVSFLFSCKPKKCGVFEGEGTYKAKYDRKGLIKK